MMSVRFSPASARALACMTLSALAASASGAVFTYNPSLGSLPQAQGWDFAGSFNAPMSVSGGTLTYGATTVNGTTFWRAIQPDPIDFATETSVIEIELKLTGSDFGNFSGFRRAGFAMLLQDDAGRWIIAEIGDNRVGLGNDDNRTSDPSALFNFADGFHTVRLEAGPTGGRLYVDGTLMLSLALGGGRTGGAQSFWGDGTILANANLTEIRSVIYTPTPGATALLAAAGLVGLRRRR
ncbi:MAG: hypothetical protein SFY95_03755 [Planctomycetota bacterium]|nr:hypothetical protein [Planctomycetota bacterium]